jgi:putative Mn2+ efflux pump MntP
MDCFAVSVTFGSSLRLKWRDILRMALFFGLFQGAMPVIGWAVGASIQSFIEPVDHWIAFAILFVIGLKMVLQSFAANDEKKQVDIRDLRVLLTLSVATSIDALITGVGFGFIRANIYLAVGIITVVTFLVSVLGAKLASHTKLLPARWAEFAGGIVLIAIGVKVVCEHLGIF